LEIVIGTRATAATGAGAPVKEIAAMRPHPIDDQTAECLRKLVVAMYEGRDDLYAAAAHLDNEDLAEICHKLADDLAGDTAYLEQIVVSHGIGPGFEEAVTSALSDQIMRLFREGRGDEGVIFRAGEAQSELHERIEETIGATTDAEVQSLLDQQKRHIQFAERVLRQAGRAARQ
jgi:hypothetical protein